MNYLTAGMLDGMRRTAAGNRPSSCTVYRKVLVKTPTGGWLPSNTPTVVAHSGLRLSLAGADASDQLEAAAQVNKQFFTLALDPDIEIRPEDYVVEAGSGREFDVVAQQGPRSTGVETIVLATETLDD